MIIENNSRKTAVALTAALLCMTVYFSMYFKNIELTSTRADNRLSQLRSSMTKPDSPPGSELKSMSVKDEAKIKKQMFSKPILFVKNDGGLSDDILFYSQHHRNPGMVFTKQGVSIFLADRGGEREPATEGSQRTRKEGSVDFSKVTLTFPSKDQEIKVTAEDMQKTTLNFFTSKDRNEWRSNVKTYASVMYHDVYDGVDIKFY